MDKSIFSNITAQAQKLFNGAKSIVLEDGLLTKSFDGAVNNYTGKTQSRYVNYLNAMKGSNDIEGLERVTAYKGSVLGHANKDIKFGGIGISEKNNKNINQAVANRLAYDTVGVGNKGLEKDYKKGLRKAKNSITGSTAKNMLGNYYISPLTSGISSMKSTSFKDNKNLHKAIGRIGGTALIGGTAIGAVVANTNNDDELQMINNRLLSKYNSGEL